MRAVTNPSEILITQKEDQLSGIAIAATIEGMQAIINRNTRHWSLNLFMEHRNEQ